MTLGFNAPLYILPFDHRGSFETKMFGWTGDLTAEQIQRLIDGMKKLKEQRAVA